MKPRFLLAVITLVSATADVDAAPETSPMVGKWFVRQFELETVSGAIHRETNYGMGYVFHSDGTYDGCIERGSQWDTAKPVPAKPAKSEPSKSEPGQSESTKSEPAKSEPSKSKRTKSEPGKSEPTKSEPTKSEPAKSEPTKSEPAKSEPTKSEPAKSEPTKSESTQSGSAMAKPTATGDWTCTTDKSGRWSLQAGVLTLNVPMLKKPLRYTVTVDGRTMIWTLTQGATKTRYRMARQ